jgi:hypothetical protein
LNFLVPLLQDERKVLARLPEEGYRLTFTGRKLHLL